MALSDTLTKQVGPLPAWGWGAVIVGGYVAYRVVRGGGSSTTGAGVPVDMAGTTSDSGGGSSSGASTGQPDTSGLQAAIDALRAALAGAAAGVGGGGGGGGVGGSGGGGGATPTPSGATPTPSPSFDTSPFEQPGTGAPITITDLSPTGFGIDVSSGAFQPTPAQMASMVRNAFQGLPTGLSYGTPAGASYPVGSIRPSVPVDLSGPSQNTATYLQQLFAIEAGGTPIGVWPSEATNPTFRKQEIASLTGSIVSSGPAYYGANYGGLTPDQIRYAANIASPFGNVGTAMNPVIETALINAANAVQANPNALLQAGATSGAPPSITNQPMIGTPNTPAPSTTPSLMTLSEFNAANRAATIQRLNAAKGASNISTQDVNAQIAANYQKYLAANK